MKWFGNAAEFAKLAGLVIDELGQMDDQTGEFFGFICPDCGKLRTSEHQLMKLGWYLKAKMPDIEVDMCPVCECGNG
jgi:hypothetical protein